LLRNLVAAQHPVPQNLLGSFVVPQNLAQRQGRFAGPCPATGLLDEVLTRRLAFLLLRCPATGLLGETLLENFVLAQECLFRKFCCTTAPYPTPPNRIARPAPENPSGRSVAAQKRRAAGTGPCLFFPTDQFSLFY